MPSAQPIGIFDSGVGGLSVWRHIRQQLPQEQLLYYADQGHVPYGPRPAAEILTFARQITDFLLAHNAKLIVIACNTATAAALKQLRLDYPAVPFVGMEPAVKPGAQLTRSGVVAVLARAGTFQSQQYASLMERFGRGITLLEDPCLGLVEQIETGATASAATRALLADIVIASRDAFFMSGYSKLGALPDLGILQTLPWAIGSLRAKEMIMLNRRYTAEEAVAIGLANRAVAPEKLMEEALAAAHEIADGPRAMMTMSKVMMKRAYEDSVEEFFEREAVGQAITFGSAEFHEGVDAFLAKRKPKFV